MQEQGYRVIPFNPNEAYVLGVPASRTLPALSQPIDLVTVFRRPDQVEPHCARRHRSWVRAM
jgi:predicted CoA-binding protein